MLTFEKDGLTKDQMLEQYEVLGFAAYMCVVRRKSDGSYRDNKLGRNITYNPYKYDTFVYSDDLTPVQHSDRVYLTGKTIWEVV